jgi:hypothetical protein
LGYWHVKSRDWETWQPCNSKDAECRLTAMMIYEEMEASKVDRNLFVVMVRCELLTQVLDIMPICIKHIPTGSMDSRDDAV